MERVFTQTFGVVGALLEREGKFLLVREARLKGPDNRKWSHPAGWIDVGENPIDAVRREVAEESGFQFKPTHVLGVYSLVRKDIAKARGALPHAIKIIFIGTKASVPSRNLADDVSEIKWFSVEEIAAMDQTTLRDLDIKQMVKDYNQGKRYPLDILTHTVSS